MKTKYFSLITLLILSVLGCLCFFSNHTASLENRTLANFYMVLEPDEDSIAYADSALERFEAAMKDQFFFRESVISLYLRIDNILTSATKSKIIKSDNENKQYSYTVVGDYAQIDDTTYIINIPIIDMVPDSNIIIHINQIEQLHQMYPNIRFYSYYVAQADETGWFNEYLGTVIPNLYDLVEQLLPNYVKSGRLFYDDLDDYKHCHYASDHHWNLYGAKRGYEDIYSLMREDLGLSAVRTPIKLWDYSKLYDFKYRGSYARRLGELYTGADDFSAFEYDLPKREIYAINPETFEEIPLSELGLFEEYSRGDIDTEIDHYIAYYGTGIPRTGEGIYGEGSAVYLIKNVQPETKHNLLIYGDSYNRAIRDVLGSHFGTTIYFQRDILENYENVFIDKLIERYDIDVILYSGNKSIWTNNSYIFDFSSKTEEILSEETEGVSN